MATASGSLIDVQREVQCWLDYFSRAEATASLPADDVKSVCKMLVQKHFHYRAFRNGVKAPGLRRLEVAAELDNNVYEHQFSTAFEELGKHPTPLPLTGGRREGLNGRPYATKRAATVDGLLKLVETAGYVVLRGAPASGKTSLLQLCCWQAEAMKQFARVWWFPAHGLREDETFDEALTRELGLSWKEVSSPASSPAAANSPPTLDLLLIDEAQLLYPEDRKAGLLFLQMKLLGQGDMQGQRKRLRIMLAAMYGQRPSGSTHHHDIAMASPIDFEAPHVVAAVPASAGPSNSTPQGLSLALTRNEFTDLLNSHQIHCQWEFGLQDSVLLDDLFDVTNGQVGTITKILDLLQSKLQNNIHLPAGQADECLRYIMTTKSLYSTLGDSRSFMDTSFLAKPAYVTVLNKMVRGRALLAEEEDVVKELQRRGILHIDDDGKADFISRLHRIYYSVAIHGQQSGPRLQASEDLTLPTFVEATIRRMSSGRLRKSLGVGARNTLLEAAYQHEFYHAAQSVAPLGTSISPEAGKFFGGRGAVDFYIQLDSELNPRDSPGWMVELLRDGDRAADHLKRFAAGGKYAPIKCCGYLLIDFRVPTSSSLPRTLLNNFMYVSFVAGFTSANVTRPDGSTTEIPLGP